MSEIKPGLIIGVGGSGYWILSLLKRQLYINYGIDAGDSPDIKFLLLDTLSDEKFETEYQEHIKSIGEKFTIKRREYLHLGEGREGFFTWANNERSGKNPYYQWFRRDHFIENYPVEANWKLNEGAAQLRQFGRMAFFFNKDRIKQSVVNLLDEIKKSAGSATIPVWIFGSFAGGTGAGMMLDVAMLTKLIADQRGLSIRSIGGIVLPDVYKDTIQTSPAQGYSAFRELSRFLSKTNEEHRAEIDKQRCAQAVRFDNHDTFHHNRFIFDNIIYFNQECNSDDQRKNYFNKITDGITVFFDSSGAKDFFDDVINHKENRVTSISTYKIFVPINLYSRLFTAQFLQEQVENLFPNNEHNIISSPGDDARLEISRQVTHFLEQLSPYFMELKDLCDNDKATLEYTQNHLLQKPKAVFMNLFGYHSPEKYFGDDISKANYREMLENLYKNIYENEKVKKEDELKRELKTRRKHNPDYSLNDHLTEFKNRLDRSYKVYERIFKHGNEDRETVKTGILNHFKNKLKSRVREGFDTWGVSEAYFFLEESARILTGGDGSQGIKGVLEGIVKNTFAEERSTVMHEVDRVAGKFSDVETKKQTRVLGLFSSESDDYETVVKLMTDYLDRREKALRFAQADNLVNMLIEIHNDFAAYLNETLLQKLIRKNGKISIEENSIKSRLLNQVLDIRSVMEGGVGKASSIGISGSKREVEKYEKYLAKNIFAEKPYASLSVVFDEEKEDFLVRYKDKDGKIWYDNEDIDVGFEKKKRFWEKIIDDVRLIIEENRLPKYDGIMHYLNWAKTEYKDDERFNTDLEKQLEKAKDFIALVDASPQKYRLIYGDKQAAMYNLEDDVKALKMKLSDEVGSPVVDSFDTSTKIDFGDRNSLILLAYSNEIIPESIEVLKRMKDEYLAKLTASGTIDWRAFVYHNYTCDWKMWEIEQKLPEFKADGLKSLTHGSFYWVLEEDEKVEEFVLCTALGLIREETSVDDHTYWVCGPIDRTYEDNRGEVYLLSQEKQSADMFTALVNFAVTQKQVGRIDHIDFGKVERMRKALLKDEQAKGGKTFAQLKEDFVQNNEIGREYNRELDVDDYAGHRDLFLARVFWYYLKEK